MQRIRMSIRRRLVPVICLLLVVVPPSVAYAESFNYVDSAFWGAYDYGETSGTNPRQYNKVWRPAGVMFRLWYSSSGYFDWYNEWSNPFTVNVSINDAWAGCQNYTVGTVSPVTCQTTRP